MEKVTSKDGTPVAYYRRKVVDAALPSGWDDSVAVARFEGCGLATMIDPAYQGFELLDAASME